MTELNRTDVMYMYIGLVYVIRRLRNPMACCLQGIGRASDVVIGQVQRPEIQTS